ncbi:MAG TPA: FMN-binding negative transcriptional regulator [Jatrophihabitans sp.]|jgi:transcriptional regulator|nr:FMN-binding negative transcriptional regulator [Jatrophihabitans sp.]
MYVPAHFAMSPDEVRELLSAVTTVDLVSTTPDGLTATFLPMLYDQQAGTLQGHVARNNPHWQVATGTSLAIVHGPDAYVRPGFHASKFEHGRVVPTWNYVTAHVCGQLVVHDDVEWVRSLVSRLTARHEEPTGQPWAMSDGPADYIEGQLRAIVGLELVVERIEAKAKLSQNKSVADQHSVRAALAAGGPGEQAVAERMVPKERRRPDRPARADTGGPGAGR